MEEHHEMKVEQFKFINNKETGDVDYMEFKRIEVKLVLYYVQNKLSEPICLTVLNESLKRKEHK